MEIGDLNAFISSSKAPANIMSATTLSVGRPEYVRETFMKVVVAHMKARSRIVTILGDKYYEELDIQDVAATQLI